jgi:hypothetical protein
LTYIGATAAAIIDVIRPTEEQVFTTSADLR